MVKRLSHKEKGFVKDIVKGETATQAILNNYDVDDPDMASVMGSQNLGKLKIQEAIKSIAEQIPDELIIEKHLALLNKKEKITKNNMTTGEIDVIDTGEIDVQAVKAGLDMTYKLRGLYAPDKQINLNLNGDVIETSELQELAKQLNEIARNNNRANISSNGSNSNVMGTEEQN